MRRRIHFLLGAATGAAAVSVAMSRRTPRSVADLAVLTGRPLRIAHRGGAALAPENTLAAFRSAVDRWNVDMIELDVRASADGRCVVIHDPTVDRTTDGVGPVSAMSHAELAELDAGYRFTPEIGRAHV